MDVSKLSDYKLIKLVRQYSDSEAYLELKKRVQKSYYRTLSSYCKKIPQLNYHEMVEQIDEVVLKSVTSYRKGKKTLFNSWFTNNSRYFILNSVKKLNELGHFIPEDNSTLDLLNSENNKYHFDTNQETKDHVFSFLKNYNDSRVIKIFELRFYGDKNERKWKNISKKLKLSTQQIMNIYNKCKERLYKNMVKENNK